jgi:hypothetical protein
MQHTHRSAARDAISNGQYGLESKSLALSTEVVHLRRCLHHSQELIQAAIIHHSSLGLWFDAQVG